MKNQYRSILAAIGVGVSAIALSSAAWGEPIFTDRTARAQANLPSHIARSQTVVINRRALNAPTIEIDLFGETVTAVRTRVERDQGTITWVGAIGGNPADRVIFTSKGNGFSGRITRNGALFQITGDRQAGLVLNQIDVSAFPENETDALVESSDPIFTPTTNAVAAEAVVQQDLLMVYTHLACEAAGGVSGADCSQIEADITAAVADMNQAMIDSNIDIHMNVSAFMEVIYDEPAFNDPDLADAIYWLSAIRSTTDGIMDEVHPVRDDAGADLVALITSQSGGFCGLGYVSVVPTSAFSMTWMTCLPSQVLAHEIGHNQGMRHDRETDNDTTSTDLYNYGYRRCNNGDGSFDDVPAPHFATIMAYGCTGATRQGFYANPELTYMGVPTGVAVAADGSTHPANATRRLNERAATIAAFRESTSTPATPPNAPSGLNALAAGADAITITWSDNSSDETSFTLDRSADNTSWTTIANLGANSSSFVDNGLEAETTYYYRVSARNGAGSSGFSNTGSATTDALPTTLDDVATGQILGTGSVTGAFGATHSDDGAVQTITEVSTGGSKRRRQQAYTHTWTFDVLGGAGGVMLNANAWVSGSEGANFYYSTDNGASYNFMFTVSETATSTTKSYTFPGGTAGPVRIQVQSAEQSNGEGVDSVSIDSLIITSNTEVGLPPAAPANMTAVATGATSVDLSFIDSSDDEFGFDIRRATSDPAGICSAGSSIGTAPAHSAPSLVTYTDTSASPSTTYWYWAIAFNAAGDNGRCSNMASVTTEEAPALSATGSGYKVKGAKVVDLTWSGATGAQVDIRRDGAILTTTANDGAYTDNIGSKGGGTYTYEVCESGSTSACSPSFNVVF